MSHLQIRVLCWSVTNVFWTPPISWILKTIDKVPVLKLTSNSNSGYIIWQVLAHWESLDIELKALGRSEFNSGENIEKEEDSGSSPKELPIFSGFIEEEAQLDSKKTWTGVSQKPFFPPRKMDLLNWTAGNPPWWELKSPLNFTTQRSLVTLVKVIVVVAKARWKWVEWRVCEKREKASLPNFFPEEFWLLF